jgi:gas vesicle protein
MKSDKIILGVLGGVAVGALLGVLFAPDKGNNTRKKIADKSNDYTDELKYKLDNILGTITQKYEKIWAEGEKLVAEGKSKMNEVKNDGEDLLAQGKASFNEVKKDINSI